MIHHVVAVNNLTLRADNVDHETLVAYATVLDHELERNREQIAKYMEDVMIFGYGELRLCQ